MNHNENEVLNPISKACCPLLPLYRWLCLLSGGARCGVPVPSSTLLRHHPPKAQPLAPPLSRLWFTVAMVVKVTAETDISDTLIPGDRPLLWPYWNNDMIPRRGEGGGGSWSGVETVAGAWRTWVWRRDQAKIRNKLWTHKNCTGMSNHNHAQTCQVKLRDCYLYLYNPQTGFASRHCVYVCVCSSVSVSAYACMSARTGAPVFVCMCVSPHVCPLRRLPFHLPLTTRFQFVRHHVPTQKMSK